MAGTISECVMRSLAASSRKRSALNSGMMISVAPAPIIVATNATSPVTWLIGTARIDRSAGPIAIASW